MFCRDCQRSAICADERRHKSTSSSLDQHYLQLHAWAKIGIAPDVTRQYFFEGRITPREGKVAICQHFISLLLMYMKSFSSYRCTLLLSSVGRHLTGGKRLANPRHPQSWLTAQCSSSCKSL